MSAYHNMTAWMLGLRRAGGLEGLAAARELFTTKSTDLLELDACGLPILGNCAVDYPLDERGEALIRKTIEETGCALVRAAPEGPQAAKLERRHRLVSTVEEAKSFLDEAIGAQDSPGYMVLVGGAIPCDLRYGGVLATDGLDLVAEITDGEPNGVEHGSATVYRGVMDASGIRRMRYSDNCGEAERGRLWQAALAVSSPDELGFPHFSPGYYEFVIRDGGSMVFLDCKRNDAYCRVCGKLPAAETATRD